MTKYTITGSRPLKGTVKLHGAKNAGFKAMIASLLGDSPSEISGLGLVSEVDFASSVISSLGASVTKSADPHTLIIDASGLSEFTIPPELGTKSRSSTMYVGPLLHRFGKALLPVPTGDKIGVRPIDRHIEGLEALGAKVKFLDGCFDVSAPNRLRGNKYRFAKNSHTGTETLLMCAAIADGVTTLENAAAEPEVDDLIKLLNAMGGQIERVAPRTIRIKGVASLHGARHAVMPDRMEAATFACMAIATKGEIEVQSADPIVMTAFLDQVKLAGAGWQETPGGLVFKYVGPLKPTNITAAPYPAFMTDWQPIWTALMTQAEGVSTVFETIYENRFAYIINLEKMGGRFEFFNPPVSDPEKTYNFNLNDDKPGAFHAVRIFGPQQLSGAQTEISDIRQGATILLAGLMADGTSVITDPKDQIRRGYEDLVGRLQSLGAAITVAG